MSLALVEKVRPTIAGQVLSRQLARCSTSVGANYRAACRARSKADFISKLKIVEEETDETLYWLELLHEGGYVDAAAIDVLQNETNEILRIIVSSINTVRRNETRKERPKSNLRS